MSWMVWALIGVGVFLLFSKRSVLLPKNTEKIAGIALVGVGLVMGGFFDGLSTSSQSAVTGEVADVTLSGGIVNGTGVGNHITDADFYSNDDDTVTFYIDDADIQDDGYINVSLNIERSFVTDAESYLLECTSADFTKSGTTYNIVSKNTDSELEGYVDGAGTQRDGAWSKYIAFTEGDVDQSVTISYKQDEAAEDILASKESVDVVCTVGDKTITIVNVAND